MDYNLVNFNQYKELNIIKKTTPVNLTLTNEEKKQLLGFNNRNNKQLCNKIFLEQLKKNKLIKVKTEDTDLNQLLKIFLEKYKMGELYPIILPRYIELINKYDKSYFVAQGESLCNFVVRRILLELEMLDYREKLPILRSNELGKYSNISNNSISESIQLVNKLYSSIKNKEYNKNNSTDDEEDW